jgi:membrane associated rhomboid family serine protease
MAFDPEFKKNVFRAFYFPIMLIALLWVIKGMEYASGMSLSAYGIYPMKAEGLPGILLAPLIHADLNHLFNNSFSLLILTAAIFYFYKPIAFKIILLVWIVTGLCVWLGGRKAYHIGASGLVYGFASFLFFSGVLRKNIKLLAISLLVIFLYGGLIWGIFPIFPEMSWESHLFGGLTGLFFAFVYADEGPQKEEKHWEEEQDDEDEFPYWKVDEAAIEEDQKNDDHKPITDH